MGWKTKELRRALRETSSLWAPDAQEASNRAEARLAALEDRDARREAREREAQDELKSRYNILGG